MKTIFLILALSFFSNSAQASVDGSWIGWGTWGHGGGEDRCQVQMSYHETDSFIHRLGASFDCTVVGMESGEAFWEKRDGKLYFAGVKAGTYTDNGFEALEAYNEAVQIRISVQRTAGHLDYSETWIHHQDGELYQIKARVFGPNSKSKF